VHSRRGHAPVSSPREQTEHIRGKLTEELQTLTLLEIELRLRPLQDVRQRIHLDNISIAVSHLRKCLNQLDLAVAE